jgi:NAD-dependent dihydropyrimidine dehydrogenase PreA subunit
MIEINRTLCCYCGTCVAICPNGNLELIDTFLTNASECNRCKACVKICPVGALEVKNEE